MSYNQNKKTGDSNAEVSTIIENTKSSFFEKFAKYKMKKKILILTMLLCLIGFSKCVDHEPVNFVIPSERYCELTHNFLIGKWQLVGKSYDLNSKDGYVDVTDEGKYIEFTRIEDKKYGKFLSNMNPEEVYYIPTSPTICFYYSLDSLNKSSKLVDYYLLINTYYSPDTVRFGGNSHGWFGDNSLYREYHFVKMEDE